MFRITRKWMSENSSSPNCDAWTRDQLACLNIHWPMDKGWMGDILGAPITDEAKARFESYRGCSKKKSHLNRPPKEPRLTRPGCCAYCGQNLPTKETNFLSPSDELEPPWDK